MSPATEGGMRIGIIIATVLGLSLGGCAGSPTAPAPALTAAERAILADFPQAPVSPPLPKGPITKIVLGSCLNEEWNRNQTALERMTAEKADLAILMGDNVYGSATEDDPELSDLRASYWQQARRKEFVGLVSSTPTLAIWDDHDFGKNDGGGADYPGRVVAQKMFDAFWRVAPDDPRAHPNGVYGSWILGPKGQRVQIILLDTRYWRSPLKPTDQRNAKGKERYLEDSTPGKTVLGEGQWRWLEGELKKPADLRLVVSSIQLVALGHGYEKWGNFPPERQRFFDLVKSTGAKGVVVVSGDRHYTSINKEPTAAGYPIYDFTSSAINMPWSAGDGETLPTMITRAYTQENFGMVSIDWAARSR
jgi:alkaline phosphatase D